MSTLTCLVTGFEPFLDHPVNPTERIVQALHGQTIGDYRVEGRVLPVVFEEAGKEIIKQIQAIQPDAIISLGLAAGRAKISLERIAINCMDGPKDNQGRAWQDQAIEEHGENAYFSSLPIRRMFSNLQEKELPVEISNSAGTYVCNLVMYKVLHYLSREGKSHLPAGFIHVPANHELAIKQPRYPSWSTEDLIKAIRSCIEIINYK